VGEQGFKDAEEMTSLAANLLGLASDEVAVASTGLIGSEMPMALVRQNIGNISVTAQGGSDFARSIMTTDSRPKEVAVSVDLSGGRIIVGGAAKGVGMIHPNMATMLCFLSTDAKVQPAFLQSVLSAAVDSSFNMIDVDGDMSTNDTVLVLANGAAGGPEIGPQSDGADAFREAIAYVCTVLAKELARDGEGAQRLIEVVVEGAKDLSDARVAAREIASSLLVRAMVHGRDPNWGRIMMALGKSMIDFSESQVDLFISDIHMVHEGVAFPYMKEAVINAMSVPEVQIRVNVNNGDATATAWGCDLTEDYVTFNSAYST
jgi:glutamate N-acetyltransferase/amino-acid N-acetyltransferase